MRKIKTMITKNKRRIFRETEKKKKRKRVFKVRKKREKMKGELNGVRRIQKGFAIGFRRMAGREGVRMNS